jgi:hypothetical protein
VSFEDFGLGEIEEALAQLAATEITIGWQGASGAEIHPGSDDLTVADIAALNELGTSRMPARPALETLFSRYGDEMTTAVGRTMSDMIDGRIAPDVSAAVKAIGDVAVSALRRTLDSSRGWAEPLVPSTVARKGHDQPLLETGTLRSHASWAERRGGQIVTQGGEE